MSESELPLYCRLENCLRKTSDISSILVVLGVGEWSGRNLTIVSGVTSVGSSGSDLSESIVNNDIVINIGVFSNFFLFFLALLLSDLVSLLSFCNLDFDVIAVLVEASPVVTQEFWIF